ncbi:MAG: hypothetical protein H7Y31_04680, partial [Chitinophagaceae bacterium]|nr:hypothetical protein [Chitinophagaceae bacterium]
MFKKSLFSVALIGAGILALASSGGGEKKKKSTAVSGASIVKSTPGFSLKAGRSLSSPLSFKTKTSFSLTNTVVTYRRGNTIYIVPGKYPKHQVGTRNNLNMLNLKLNIKK